MTKFVPYLREAVIERDATALLAEYAAAQGCALTLPIPIEDIVEKHLKLGVEFDDAHRRFGVPDGIRTRVLALKGPRPRPLDDGDAEVRNIRL